MQNPINQATNSNTSNASSEYLPEHVEAAAREIHTALSTFLRTSPKTSVI